MVEVPIQEQDQDPLRERKSLVTQLLDRKISAEDFAKRMTIIKESKAISAMPTDVMQMQIDALLSGLANPSLNKNDLKQLFDTLATTANRLRQTQNMPVVPQLDEPNQ